MAQWNGEKRITPYLPAIGQTLQVTQGIERFQRRLRGILASQGTLVGERVRFAVVVPKDEAWLIRYIQFRHDDDIPHRTQLALRYVVAPIVPGTIIPIDTFISPGGAGKCIYPTRPQRMASTSNDRYDFIKKLEFFEGLEASFETITATSAPSATYDLTVWYELIPARRDISQGTPWVGSAI